VSRGDLGQVVVVRRVAAVGLLDAFLEPRHRSVAEVASFDYFVRDCLLEMVLQLAFS
jgi:hypothetical protein